MSGDTESLADTAGRHPHRSLLVLGANGPTGRQTVRQALERGHRVEAVTRHPEAFPIRHERLRVVAGDATDPAVIDRSVSATDAAICTIGAQFTMRSVDVYSATARLLTAAMIRHGRRRLIVVTSAGVRRSAQERGALRRASYLLMRRVIGRTVYDDMTVMEATVSASELEWTIVHPPGLVSEPGRGYAVAPNEIEGHFCSREDLARMLLDQLDDVRFHRGIAAVATPGLSVGATYMIWHEVLKC